MVAGSSPAVTPCGFAVQPRDEERILSPQSRPTATSRPIRSSERIISKIHLETGHVCSWRPEVSGVGAGASHDIAVGNR
jgi:hypothetical protein